MTEIAVEISGFSKRYKNDVFAVDHIDLKVKKRSFLGFVGTNGAGKTTTVHFIAGLIRKTEGNLCIFGETISKSSYKYKRDIGFVLEKPFYIERLTAREYINYMGQLYGLEKDLVITRTKELMSFMSIEDDKKIIKEFSAGMKKKVSLAAALIHDPKLLVLDEPFEGIDAVSSRQIKDNLILMVEKGRTIIITSHVLDLVEKICDEVAVINKGKIVFQGRMDSIKEILKQSGKTGENASLEELFLSLVSEPGRKDKLSWL